MSNQLVHTYHCTFCSHLLLATTLNLPSLPTRKAPGLDNAIIAPLPPPPRDPDDSEDEESSSSEEEEEEEEELALEPKPGSRPTGENEDPEGKKQPEGEIPTTTSATIPPSESTSSSSMAPPPTRILPPHKDYTLLLSSTRDRTPKIITRDDGFEKRYLWRCGRCKLVIGYQLDEMHYPTLMGNEATTSASGKKKRKKKDFVYFLPGALVATEELGRVVKEGETEFVGVEGVGV